MKVLALVDARGGSKGVPRKNVRPLLGKPLIAWSIEAGLAAARVASLVVSTDEPRDRRDRAPSRRARAVHAPVRARY